MLKRLFKLFGFIVIYIILVYLASWYNDYPLTDYRSEIYGDKTGYYMYLPATFIHGYYQDDYPEDIVSRLHGFNFVDGKLFDKYPIGVSVLTLPFFLAAHMLTLAEGGVADGFSSYYYEMANFSSVFYFLAGASLLYFFLRRRYSTWISLTTTLLIMFGTNAYYYALREPLMSHVYSFALFSLLLLLVDNLWKSPSARRYFLVALTSGIILLVRPINVIILLVIPLLGLQSWQDLRRRIRFMFLPGNLLVFIGIVLILFIPQMIYWHFISGKFLFYSYGEESFKYWSSPRFVEVLFSPHNGLLPYSPAYLLLLPGMLFMMIKREENRWLAPVLFLAILYMAASWHSYHFGCSFGQRTFVEYLAVFSLPIAALFKWGFKILYPYLKIFMLLILLYLAYVNIALTGVYQKCYFGGDWEWQPYRYYFISGNIFPFDIQKNVLTWQNDFENGDGEFFSKTTKIIEFQGLNEEEHVAVADETKPYTGSFGIKLATLMTGRIAEVKVSQECYYRDSVSKALLVCSIEDENGIKYYQAEHIDESPDVSPGKWFHYSATFKLNDMKPHGYLKVYTWLVEGGLLYVDDVKVQLIRKD